METVPHQTRQAEYGREGYVIVTDLLTPGECDELKTEAKRVLQQQASRSASVCVHVAAVSRMFRNLWDSDRVVAILEVLMPDGVMFLSDKIVYKTADKTFPTPWHIDRFYWRGTRPKLSVWIPLDDASVENGTLTVVPGSHTKDWTMVKKGLPNGEFGDEVGDATWQRNEIVTCTIRRGTAVFFSDALVHGSAPNTSGRERYAIIGTYHAPRADEPFDLDFPARKVLRPARR
jgi:ectoine hydroxylase-related dioxygenase (phytanoyl-CoA dioxygenase family)